MPAQQASSGRVVFAEDGPVDVVEAIAGHQAVPAGGAGEALRRERADGQTAGEQQPGFSQNPTNLQVIDAALGPHHHLTGGDGLSTGAAGSAVAEESAGETNVLTAARFQTWRK